MITSYPALWHTHNISSTAVYSKTIFLDLGPQAEDLKSKLVSVSKSEEIICIVIIFVLLFFIVLTCTFT